MITLPNEYDQNDTESGSDDDEPSPMNLLPGGDDDDEPPAAGAVMVEVGSSPELETSLAPTAEPNHKAKPEVVVTA